MTFVILLKTRIFRSQGRGSETVEGKQVYRMACKLTMTKRVFYSFTFISPRLTSRSPDLSADLSAIQLSSVYYSYLSFAFLLSRLRMCDFFVCFPLVFT